MQQTLFFLFFLYICFAACLNIDPGSCCCCCCRQAGCLVAAAATHAKIELQEQRGCHWQQLFIGSRRLLVLPAACRFSGCFSGALLTIRLPLPDVHLHITCNHHFLAGNKHMLPACLQLAPQQAHSRPRAPTPIPTPTHLQLPQVTGLHFAATPLPK